MNFYESFYTQYRSVLVRYGLRFHQSMDVSEDLFEDCHLALCEKYDGLDSCGYLRIMKTSIKYRGLNLKCSLKTDVSLWKDSSLADLLDTVIQKEEIKRMLRVIRLMSKKDQDLLRSITRDGKKLYKVKQKLRILLIGLES